MSFAKVFSAQPSYPHAHLITVETDLTKGLHAFTIVGLPDKAVEESRDRVAAAVKNSGFTSPKASNRKIVVSLAPADSKKEGPIFDVAIAISYLLASGELSCNGLNKAFLGELALNGEVRPVHGVLSAAIMARENSIEELYVPFANAEEAALVRGIKIYAIKTLKELVDHLLSQHDTTLPSLTEFENTTPNYSTPQTLIDFNDVRGQESAKRGLEIAAADRHNIALFGPPGTGKSMLAKSFASILPPLSFTEALEATAIHSLAGTLTECMIMHPPFRAPHHTSSHVSLVGGGAIPRPGEVTLAHRGVLFLDEFPEFERRTIDALRQPLEDRVVSISRARGSMIFPANFMLVAALNPHLGNQHDEMYDELARKKYLKKISGPIIDRIDIWIEVGHVDHEELAQKNVGEETSHDIRTRVIRARARQEKRFQQEGKYNSDMSVKDIDQHITMKSEVRDLLNASAKKIGLSPRSYHRMLKLAQTIADLDERDEILDSHIFEALQYRPKGLFE